MEHFDENFSELNKLLLECFSSNGLKKLTISNPVRKSMDVFRITVTPMRSKASVFFQFEEFIGTKVSHRNIESSTEAAKYALDLVGRGYKQCDIIMAGENIKILINKKRNFKVIRLKAKENVGSDVPREHNRVKNYILDTVAEADWLHKLGITNTEGHILKDKHKKFAQINKFLEMVAGILHHLPEKPYIIDYGCGKAYLTFALYKYLCNKGYYPEIIGIDLKTDVIKYCEAVAREIGANGLHFVVGDINNYEFGNHPADMVVTLHACDTATDYALYNAVRLGAKVIMSAPCCQHELFTQIENNDFNILLRYGIIKERFSTLLTDAIRSALLECCGYKSRIVEFIDSEHTPKNIMLEAVRSDLGVDVSVYKQVVGMMRAFNIRPKLYVLLEDYIERNHI